jgi:hypothetical protein
MYGLSLRLLVRCVLQLIAHDTHAAAVVALQWTHRCVKQQHSR